SEEIRWPLSSLSMDSFHELLGNNMRKSGAVTETQGTARNSTNAPRRCRSHMASDTSYFHARQGRLSPGPVSAGLRRRSHGDCANDVCGHEQFETEQNRSPEDADGGVRTRHPR